MEEGKKAFAAPALLSGSSGTRFVFVATIDGPCPSQAAGISGVTTKARVIA